MTDDPTPDPTAGKKAEDMKELQLKTNKDILLFLLLMIRQNRKWFLLPLLLLLAFLSIFVRISGNHAILPAIYALF
jgi:hypothetical protein